MAGRGLCRTVPGCPLESDRQSPGAGSLRADIGPHRATPIKANTELLMERLFLIDAYALIFRAYYAFIGRPMRNSEGLNTSAIFGFVKFLRDLIRREEPRMLGVAFDPKGGNFRHEIYPQYKANREATPEDIIAAVPYIKRVLEAMRIPVIEVPGYEADDVIGTLSMKAAGAGYEVYMVTPDKDYGQLIRPTVRIYKQRKGGDGIEVIGCEQIREHYGIDDPCRVIDILALWGDASDNIPGVPGIGEKSAIKLVCEFGTVENLLENTDKLKGKQRENIEALREQILLAKRLATIELNVPVEFDPAGLTMENPDLEMLADVYRELGFRSFFNELQGNPFVTAAGVAGTASGAGRGSAGQAAAHASRATNTGRGFAGGVGATGLAGTAGSAGTAGAGVSAGSSGLAGIPGIPGMPGTSGGRGAGMAGSRAAGSAVQDASQGSLFDAFGQVPDAGAAVVSTSVPVPHPGIASGSYSGNFPAGQRDLFAGPGEVSGVGETVHDPNRDAANVGAAGDLATSGDGLFGQQYQTIDTVPHTYHTVTEPAELEALAARLGACEAFCFDTETTGFDVFGDRLVGISVAIEPHEAWYIPCDRENTDRVVAALRPVFADEKIAKIGQNIKFDLMVLRSAGIEVWGRLYDTMIIHYLLDPESRHGMDHLSRTFLGYDPVPIEALIGKGAKQKTMDMVPVATVAAYAAEDADVTLRLYRVLWPLLMQAGLTELYAKIEEPLIPVLADIEMTGVKIDTAALAAFGQELTGELAALEERIRETTGDPSLNVNSAKQLGEALFGRMKIDPKPKMTKTKQYRTDEEYLQMLADRHPVIGMILEYRGLRKLLSTYVDALPQLVNPLTGRIHTSFNQAVTATGRLSSTNPNLQNIPIRDDRGREIRKAFIPSSDDRVLLSADYSQVELRLMAHLSGDRAMIEAFGHGEDIHTATAALLFHAAKEDVTREQRRRAKTANFGIIYGISAFGLAQRLNIPRTEAKEIIDGYFQSYPDIRQYMERVIDQARENGYVETLFGRKRMLPDIRSGNAVVRGLSERNAINAPIQGGAADIMKLAMIAVHGELRRKGLQSKIILQVHDELVLDVLLCEQEQVREIVIRCMEGAAELKVKLVAECGVGRNWLEAH